MKLVSALTYVIYLEKKDMYCINKVVKTYSRISRVIILPL